MKPLHLLLCFVIKFVIVSMENENNVCSNISDYATIDINSNCWYNPDVGATTITVIKNNGYDFESHTVITTDGYILTVYRVFSPKVVVNPTYPVIFLQHGLSTDSVFWVAFGKERSLAFRLVDLGYDVWLGNARGTDESNKHINISLTIKEYWNFSFQEMGVYDLPAEISLVANVSKNAKGNIVYIGHSMGTTMSYIYALTAHANEYLKSIISFAPIAYMGHVTSSLIILVPWAQYIQDALSLTGIYELSFKSKIGSLNISDFCLQFINIELCLQVISSVCGYSNQLLPQDIPILIKTIPSAPASTKTLVHYSQFMLSQGIDFQQFDYGTEKNLVVYGNKRPPSYDVQNIKIPVYLCYGDNDAFGGEKDPMKLYSILTTQKFITNVSIDNDIKFNHLDFASAKNIDFELYPLVYDILKY